MHMQTFSSVKLLIQYAYLEVYWFYSWFVVYYWDWLSVCPFVFIVACDWHLLSMHVKFICDCVLVHNICNTTHWKFLYTHSPFSIRICVIKLSLSFMNLFYHSCSYSVCFSIYRISCRFFKWLHVGEVDLSTCRQHTCSFVCVNAPRAPTYTTICTDR